MTGWKVLATVIVAAIAAECMLGWALSLHPLATEKDSVLDAALEGTWLLRGGDAWTFRRSGGRAYELTVTEQGNNAKFETRLVELGEFRFLDIFPGDSGLKNLFYLSHLIPGHSISRAWLKGDILLLAPLDPTWLKQQIERGDVKISHIRVHEHILLTAPTDDLREFVATHADDDKAFPITVRLRRQR